MKRIAALSRVMFYASFMLHLWRDRMRTPRKGEMESIQGGCTWQFEGLAPLLNLPIVKPSGQDVDMESSIALLV